MGDSLKWSVEPPNQRANLHQSDEGISKSFASKPRNPSIYTLESQELWRDGFLTIAKVQMRRCLLDGRFKGRWWGRQQLAEDDVNERKRLKACLYTLR
jgi:hypothetical protein